MLIHDHCSSLSKGARWHIQTSLKHISTIDLVGIESINLYDEVNFPIQNERSAQIHLKAKANNTVLSGAYQRKHGAQPAKIFLFIKDLYRPIPSAVWWSPVPILHVSRVLAHEVGHHLIATKGYVFEPTEKFPSEDFEEELVDRYSFSVIQRMKNRLFYKFGAALTKHVVDVYFELGSRAWKEKKYKEAAEYWYKCFLLDSERQDIIEWYWHAKNKVKAV